jgi:hypothetical protein
MRVHPAISPGTKKERPRWQTNRSKAGNGKAGRALVPAGKSTMRLVGIKAASQCSLDRGLAGPSNTDRARSK